MNPDQQVSKLTVETVLARHLEPRRVEHALSLWQAEFADLPPASVIIRYINRLGSMFALKQNLQRELRIDLSRSLLLTEPSPNAIPDAADKAQFPAVSIQQNGATQPPVLIIFASLVRHMLATIEIRGGQALTDFITALTEELLSSDLPQPLVLSMLQWSTDLNEDPPQEENPKNLSQLLALVYFSACRTCADELAEQFLKEAIAHTEQLPEARLFPPRLLADWY